MEWRISLLSLLEVPWKIWRRGGGWSVDTRMYMQVVYRWGKEMWMKVGMTRKWRRKKTRKLIRVKMWTRKLCLS